MIIDLVKWDTRNPKLLAWKFPSQELSTWTQLIVNETQEAYLVSGGVYEGPYEGSRHTLSTQNIPILRNLLGIPFRSEGSRPSRLRSGTSTKPRSSTSSGEHRTRSS